MRTLVGVVLLVGCEIGPPEGGPQAAAVEVIVEPEAGAGAVLELLAAARSSLWMEMYLLTDERAIGAIEERARAGCDVRVGLEPAPYQAEGANQVAFDRLAAAGARVRWSPARFTFTHAKAFTLDHRRLVVMTLNLTAAGLGENREYVAVDDDPSDVAAVESIFAGDETGATAGGAARVVSSPDTSRPALTALVDGATGSLALETEELTDPALTTALVAARARGVAVTVVWPGPAEGAGGPFTRLAAAGAIVRAVAAPPIHAKAAVADGRVAYLGSANLTPTSLDRNRELGLRLTDPAAAARLAGVIADDAARGRAPQALY